MGAVACRFELEDLASTTATSEGVLVFHAFAKKTRQTPPLEIELPRKKSWPGSGTPRRRRKEWQVQHVLLKRLKEIVRRQEITHAEIAKRAGTSRTRVTAILNDDLEHVSSDLLIRILASLGYRVRVS